MQSGRFEEAITGFRTLLATNPGDVHSMICLAATLGTVGQTRQANEMLQRYCQACPFSPGGEIRRNRVSVMGLRGMRDADYTLRKKAGKYSPRLRGGHFSTNDLLDTDHCNLVFHNIYDQTILQRKLTPYFDIIVNVIACADRMARVLDVAQQFVNAYPGKPVINPPALVMRTCRDENCQRLGSIDGVKFPLTVRAHYDGYSSSSLLELSLSTGLAFPMILRPTNTHTGNRVSLVCNQAEFTAYFQSTSGAGEYYVIEYVESADPDGLHNKMRVLCVDGRFYPVACLFSTKWNIHARDRYGEMLESAELQAREERWLADLPTALGAANMNRLEQVREVVKLDFFGIDFCLREDGSMLIFECNAAMRHNFSHARQFPYIRSHLEKVSQAFNTMVLQRATSATNLQA